MHDVNEHRSLCENIEGLVYFCHQIIGEDFVIQNLQFVIIIRNHNSLGIWADSNKYEEDSIRKKREYKSQPLETFNWDNQSFRKEINIDLWFNERLIIRIKIVW